MRAEIVGNRGSGQAIVYVPGIDGTGELLLGTAGRLEASFHLLRLSYHDEGMPGSAQLYERLADSVVECMTAARMERAILLAESFGGGVALQVALRHPERVQAMCLVNTFAWYPSRLRVRLGAALVPFAPGWLLRVGRVHLASRWLFRPRKDPVAEASFRKVLPGFARGGYATRMQAIPHLDLRGALPQVPMRCELYASSDDRVVPSTETMATLAAG
ncbi:MAG TPA: alpha/beta hydrolase, partial [Planctomycetota bacterium]|nr:alpha/beta hydrolase [Planctomycetota bacterium]